MLKSSYRRILRFNCPLIYVLAKNLNVEKIIKLVDKRVCVLLLCSSLCV